MKSFSTLLASLLAVVPYVCAHGYVSQVVVNGQTYQGNTPNGDTNPSPIRQISTISPVKGADNSDMFCGQSAQVASVVAPADPGSKVVFTWVGGGGENWPHNTGPLMTYMAQCAGTTCDKYTATDAKWFKIDEVGKESDGSTWFQQEIMNGATYTVSLPSNIEPGDYMIRQEIIALHLAVTQGGAEFYPSCTQVRISGNGSGTPNKTVSFPGAYKDTDPGIYDPNVFDPGSPYTFPGPPLSNLVTGDSGVVGSSSAGAPPQATGSASAPSSSSSSSPSPSPDAPSSSYPQTNSCALKSKSVTLSANKPRHFSRIMRRLVDDLRSVHQW